jgi:phage terminase small subunit
MAASKEQIAKKQDKLTPRQALFIDNYMLTLNATEAARRAGYAGDYITLKSVASENLAKPYIRNEVNRRMAEQHMPPQEILQRLATIARGDVSPFIAPDGDVDLSSEQAKANIYLVKRVRAKRGAVGGRVETEIELHDAHDALIALGRHQKLFTDRLELDADKFAEYQRSMSAFVDNDAKQLESGDDRLADVVDASALTDESDVIASSDVGSGDVGSTRDND